MEFGYLKCKTYDKKIPSWRMVYENKIKKPKIHLSKQ